MAKEDFITLFQIQSINRKINELNQKIVEENSRVTLLEKSEQNAREILNSKELDFKNLKSQLVDFENQLSNIDKKITSNKEHLISVNSQKQLESLQAGLETLTKNKESFEETIFSLFEQEEIIATEIKEKKSFLNGISKTIAEIQQDVQMINQKLKDEINLSRQEILRLEPSIESRFLQIYQTLFKQKSTLSKKGKNDLPAMSYLDGNKCYECKFQIGASISSSINTGQSTELCPECGRLLAPLSAKNIT